METKIFTVVSSISMILTLTVATLSIIGVAITGLYPGIIVLSLVTLIPIASKFYAKKIISKSNDFQKNYYTTLTIINLLSILVVLWMTFVIVHDRVLHDCC
jgi:predicted RND superfamily exporter protein